MVPAASKGETMERLLLRIWISIVTFCFGISVSAAWRIYTLPVIPDLDIEPVVERVEVLPVIESSDELRIVEGKHACGAKPDGASYELSDGGHIEITCTKFGSRAAATRELERRLINATVEERSFTIDSNGNLLDDEVVVITPNVQLLRTNGKLLCVTEATSLRHLRWFEKRVP